MAHSDLPGKSLPYSWLDLHSVEQADVLTFLSEAARLALDGRPVACAGNPPVCSARLCLACNVAWALRKLGRTLPPAA